MKISAHFTAFSVNYFNSFNKSNFVDKSNKKFTLRNKMTKGFTLVELLVVMSIMSLVGIFTLANFRLFGEDQNLKSTILDIQSFLRQAQANAKTNTSCQGQFTSVWKVEFPDSENLNLLCQQPGSSSNRTIKSIKFPPNVTVNNISGTGTNCPGADHTIHFQPVTAGISFGAVSSSSFGCTSLTIVLRSSKTSTSKSIKIEQGGKISEQ